MKKNKIYTKEISKKIGNNQEVCDVNEKDNNIVNEDANIEDKLNKLFNTNGYIFNIKVRIITNDKTYDTRIASRVGDSLITLDNDIIRIDEIKDIIF